MRRARAVWFVIIKAMKILSADAVEFGSHQFLDRLALSFHLAVAARLAAAPEFVLNQARENLNRWLALHSPDSRPAAALREWQELIETANLNRLLAAMIEDSDDGQRLRQSSPFVGVLSADEREELIRLCEKGIAA